MGIEIGYDMYMYDMHDIICIALNPARVSRNSPQTNQIGNLCFVSSFAHHKISYDSDDGDDGDDAHRETACAVVHFRYAS